MFHRFLPLLAVVSILVLIFFSFTTSKYWFFLRSGQHNIYKMGLSGEYLHGESVANYEGSNHIVPPEVENKGELASILGENVNEGKRIEIDLSHQKLYAYNNNNLVFNYTVSTGNPWTATPPGEYRTWIKLRYQRMEGGSRTLGTYYNLPNVPHIMYFYNENTPKWQGYGIHGAYWHNNFGHPMSHGCVNLQLEDAQGLYNWAGVGTRVIIYGSTPIS